MLLGCAPSAPRDASLESEHLAGCRGSQAAERGARACSCSARSFATQRGCVESAMKSCIMVAELVSWPAARAGRRRQARGAAAPATRPARPASAAQRAAVGTGIAPRQGPQGAPAKRRVIFTSCAPGAPGARRVSAARARGGACTGGRAGPAHVQLAHGQRLPVVVADVEQVLRTGARPRRAAGRAARPARGAAPLGEASASAFRAARAGRFQRPSPCVGRFGFDLSTIAESAAGHASAPGPAQPNRQGSARLASVQG